MPEKLSSQPNYSVDNKINQLLNSHKSTEEVENEARDIISEKLHQYYVDELKNELFLEKDPTSDIEPINTDDLTVEKIEENFLAFEERVAHEPKLDFVKKLHDKFPEGRFFCVGGLVRDGLLGKSSKDIDLVIAGIPPEDLEKALKDLGEVGLVGKNFGVYKFNQRSENDNDSDMETDIVDIALPRTEIAGGSGKKKDFQIMADYRLPIEEDLSRRDLTINSMAYNITNKKLVDPFNGKSDLLKKTIRTVNEPDDRFNEDLSRMLRAIRFAAKFDFKIDVKTWDSLTKNMHRIIEKEITEDAVEVQIVPWEVIGEELKKSFVSNPSKTLDLLDKSNALKYLLAEIEDLKKFEQPKKHHQEGNVFNHTKLVLKALPPYSSVSLVFGALLHDIGKALTYNKNNEENITFYDHAKKGLKLTEEICDRLHFTNKTTEKILLLVDKHMDMFQIDKMKKYKIYDLLFKKLPRELLRLNQADIKASLSQDKSPYDSAIAEIKDFQHKDMTKVTPLVTGDGLIELGLTPGKEFGNILARILELQITNNLKDEDKESLLEKVRCEIQQNIL